MSLLVLKKNSTQRSNVICNKEEAVIKTEKCRHICEGFVKAFNSVSIRDNGSDDNGDSETRCMYCAEVRGQVCVTCQNKPFVHQLT